MFKVSGAVNNLFTFIPNFLFIPFAINAPAAAPNRPTQVSFTVPITSRLNVSKPAAGPRFAVSLIDRGATIDAKSIAFAPIAWFVAKNLRLLSNAPLN